MPERQASNSPDLLHGVNGTVFRFLDGPIALKADMESMFLQVQAPELEKMFEVSVVSNV